MSDNQSEILMTYRLPLGIGSVLFLGLCLGTAGCTRGPTEAPAAEPVSVPVSYPVAREVTDYADFTARIAAVDSVDVKAHVWGYLQKVHFKEGDLVKKGDVLFEIDPRPYEAQLNQAKAKVRQDEAQLTFDEAVYRRTLQLIGTSAVSREDLEKAASVRDIDVANVEEVVSRVMFARYPIVIRREIRAALWRIAPPIY